MAGGRLVIGAAALLAARPAIGLLGFDGESSSARALARMAGARDLTLGLAQIRSLDDSDRLREATLLAVGADAADALIFAIASRRPELRRASLMSLPLAVGAVAGGLWLADRL